jgi:hypothetical protein
MPRVFRGHDDLEPQERSSLEVNAQAGSFRSEGMID